MGYTVYVLVSHSTGKRYAGQTNDLERRLAEHNTPEHNLCGGRAWRPWLGFMNVFELPPTAGGFVFGRGWGAPARALKAGLAAADRGTPVKVTPGVCAEMVDIACHATLSGYSGVAQRRGAHRQELNL